MGVGFGVAGIAAATMLFGSGAGAIALEMPKEITPAIRAACETDVRRLCIRDDSTVATVKSCVYSNFARLNSSCQFQLIKAGLVGGSTAKKARQKSASAKKTRKPAPAGAKSSKAKKAVSPHSAASAFPGLSD